jgi:hypothetical protein
MLAGSLARCRLDCPAFGEGRAGWQLRTPRRTENLRLAPPPTVGPVPRPARYRRCRHEQRDEEEQRDGDNAEDKKGLQRGQSLARLIAVVPVRGERRRAHQDSDGSATGDNGCTEHGRNSHRSTVADAITVQTVDSLSAAERLGR